MNVLLFGATGETGSFILKEALAKNHRVTAFVRNPARLKMESPLLKTFVGNLTDENSIVQALNNQDGVICSLGTRELFKKTTIISEGTKLIVSAMEKENVKRLIFMSAFGVGESFKQAPLINKFIYLTALKYIYEDKLRQESIIRSSTLDWTILHPTMLKDSPKHEDYISGESLKVTMASHISHENVADFMIRQLNSKENIHKVVTLSS